MLLDQCEARYAKADQQLFPKSVWVGTGNTPGLTWVDGQPCLVITYNFAGSPHRCTSSYVAQRPDEEIASWRAALGEASVSDDPLAGFTIVARDASPDTCLAVLLLIRRLQGKDTPGAWVDYAVRWSAGDVRSTGKPEQSWGALHSALVHPFFDPPSGSEQITSAIRWGVQYAASLLDAGADPANAPHLVGDRLHELAMSRLLAERELYRRVRDLAPKLQLSLPLAGTRRRRIVDAIILAETAPTGALKAWLRTDPESASGEGYAVFILYRPGAHGATAISVDPFVGVTLEHLWIELERREEAAWAASPAPRPRNSPRLLTSFAQKGDSLQKIGIFPSNRPWTDDNGDYTMLMSPGRIDKDTSGSKLSWPDVLDAVWSVYSPGRDIEFCNRGEAWPFSLFGAGGLRRDPLATCKDKFIVDIVRANSVMAEGFEWTPTTERACAAFIAEGAVGLNRLPDAADFEVVSGRGGAAIISHHGVFLAEYSPGQDFPASAIREVCEKAGAVLTRANELEVMLKAAQEAVIESVATGTGKSKIAALSQVYKILIEARQMSFPRVESQTDPLARHALIAIEARWGAQAKFDRVAEAAQTLESMVVSASDVKTSSLVNSLAVYGFPAAIFGNILGVAFSPLVAEGAGPFVLGVSWLSLAIYVGLTGVVTGALLYLGEYVRRRWSDAIGKTPRK